MDLEQRQKDTVEAMAQNGDADTASEAIRDAIEHYAATRGYYNGEKRDTYLRKVFGRMAWSFAYVGIGVVAVFYFLPLQFRIAAVVPFLGSVVCLAMEQLLARHEPAVSERLRNLIGRESV